MILVVGDSHTYGHGLWGCCNITDPPSSFAWPNQLNLPIINAARPGAANAEILDQFLKHYRSDSIDAVIILWSYLARIYHSKFPSTELKSSTVSNCSGFFQVYFSNYYNDHVANLELAGFVSLVKNTVTVPVLFDFIDSKVNIDLLSNLDIELIEPGQFNSFNRLHKSMGGRQGACGHHYNEDVHRRWATDYVLPALKRVGVNLG